VWPEGWRAFQRWNQGIYENAGQPWQTAVADAMPDDPSMSALGMVGNQSKLQGLLHRLWPHEVRPAEKQFIQATQDKPAMDILNSLIDALGIEHDMPRRNELVRTLHNVGMTRDLNEQAMPLMKRSNWSDLVQHRVSGAPNLSQLDAPTVLATPGPAGLTLRDTFRMDLSKKHPIDMNNLLGAYLPEVNTTLFRRDMPLTYAHETGHHARTLMPDQSMFDEMLRELGAANPISMSWLENRPFYAKQPFPKRAEELLVRLNANQPVPGERVIPRGYESVLDDFHNIFSQIYQPEATKPAGFPSDEALWSASNTIKDIISPGGWR